MIDLEQQVAVIIFEFEVLPPSIARQPDQVLTALDGFLAKGSRYISHRYQNPKS